MNSFMGNGQETIGQLKIAQALSRDYFVIYYVDFETGHFMEYNNRSSDQGLILRKTGDDFFEESNRIIRNLVMPEDQERLLSSMHKNRLLDILSDGEPYFISYRRMLRGAPRFVNLRMQQIADDPSQIVICLSDIDEKVRQERRYQEKEQESLRLSRIAQTLARDYFRIFYVNIVSDQYFEFNATDKGGELKMSQVKNDFFEVFRRDIMDKTYGPERYEVWRVWAKEALLEALKEDRSFSSIHRILLNGETVYVSIKALQMMNDDDHHIVVGLTDIDKQMKHEEEFSRAQQMAILDPMTGVKNKRAYAQLEQEINDRIRQGDMVPFGIVVCDINNLKMVNDTMGHSAGDRYIKSASREICDVFKRSPVFRLGGDEFAVYLSGKDYGNRYELLSALSEYNAFNAACGGVVIACGISEYQPGVDGSVSAVTSRADHAMYLNKDKLKKEKDPHQAVQISWNAGNHQ